MSPLAPTGSRGYADYQRLENWDSGALYDAFPVNTTAQTVSPVFDVSRYAYLGGQIQATFNSALIQLQYSSDVAGNVVIGLRSFVVSQSIAHPAQLRIPNIGPFCRAFITAFGVTPYSVAITLWGTNRFHPLEFIPQLPQLLKVSNAAVPANQSTIFNPVDYVSGPVHVFVYTTANLIEFAPQTLDEGGTWQTVGPITPAANAWTHHPLVVPPGAWRVSVNAGVNAGNVYCFISPSLTGAT